PPGPRDTRGARPHHTAIPDLDAGGPGAGAGREAGNRSRSVARDFRVDLAGPGVDAAVQALELAEAGAVQHLEGAHAANAAMAEEHQVAARIELAHALGDGAERDQRGAGDAGDLELVGLAHVDQ